MLHLLDFSPSLPLNSNKNTLPSSSTSLIAPAPKAAASESIYSGSVLSFLLILPNLSIYIFYLYSHNYHQSVPYYLQQ